MPPHDDAEGVGVGHGVELVDGDNDACEGNGVAHAQQQAGVVHLRRSDLVRKVLNIGTVVLLVLWHARIIPSGAGIPDPQL